MPLSILLFFKRRSDFSPDQFRTHMEQTYLPLFKSIMGEDHYPPTVTLRYVERVESGAGDRFGATMSLKSRNPPEAPVMLVGAPHELNWDCMCEMIYRDELQLQQSYALMNSPAGQVVKEEEERFTDVEHMRIVLMEKMAYNVSA
jgi:hypothetical protein